MSNNVIKFKGNEWTLRYKFKAFKLMGEKWGVDTIQDIQKKLFEVIQKMTPEDLAWLLYIGMAHNSDKLTEKEVYDWIDSDECEYAISPIMVMISQAVTQNMPKIKPGEVETDSEKKKT